MIVIVLMTIAWGLAIVDANECQPNEHKIYVLSDKGADATWTEALGECGRRGLSLATIKSDEEFGNFMETLTVSGRSANEHFFLGSSCEGSCKAQDKSGWYWITDNSKVASSEAVNNNWIAGQPDNYNLSQQVLVVRGDGRNWDDTGYAQEREGWVCQKCVRKTASSM